MITKIDRTVRVVAPGVGIIDEDIIRLSRDDHCNCIYSKVGTQNVDEFVNSFKDSSSLQSILNRIQLMPVRDKIQYLQMSEAGVSADMSIFPKDPTELYLNLKKYELVLPSISKELNAGKSLDTIIKDLYNMNKEVSNNGKTESSNDGSVEV